MSSIWFGLPNIVEKQMWCNKLKWRDQTASRFDERSSFLVTEMVFMINTVAKYTINQTVSKIKTSKYINTSRKSIEHHIAEERWPLPTSGGRSVIVYMYNACWKRSKVKAYARTCHSYVSCAHNKCLAHLNSPSFYKEKTNIKYFLNGYPRLLKSNWSPHILGKEALKS